MSKFYSDAEHDVINGFIDLVNSETEKTGYEAEFKVMSQNSVHKGAKVIELFKNEEDGYRAKAGMVILRQESGPVDKASDVLSSMFGRGDNAPVIRGYMNRMEETWKPEIDQSGPGM